MMQVLLLSGDIHAPVAVQEPGCFALTLSQERPYVQSPV